MFKLLFKLLDKLPYRSKFGMSLGDELKIIYYQKRGHKKNKCLCGGKIITFSCPPDGWETVCDDCSFVYDED